MWLITRTCHQMTGGSKSTKLLSRGEPVSNQKPPSPGKFSGLGQYFSDEGVDNYVIRSAFTRIYNEDKLKYGDPSDSGHRVVDARELDNWQVVLLGHAKNVEPTHKRKIPPA